MRFSIADWSIFNALGQPADVAYANLRALGIEYLEMAPPERWDAARAAGLNLLNFCAPGMTAGPNHRSRHAELLPAVRDAIARAGAARIPYVVVFSGNREGIDDATGMANCRAFYEQVLPDAAAANVTLLFEMLCEGNHADYHAQRTVFGRTLVESINTPRFKLVYDIYHQFRSGDDCAADIAALLPHIAHLHVAEAPARDVPRPGGTIPWPTMVAAARRAGYLGIWGLEYLPGANPLVELRDVIAWFRQLDEAAKA